mmetsp:Transcript_21446/g.50879  ORF Transcript_21446/g.50879 Transcript_21446/m.50879 type:complete len:211 (+) Transcript_21446:380-1012(+)
MRVVGQRVRRPLVSAGCALGQRGGVEQPLGGRLPAQHILLHRGHGVGVGGEGLGDGGHQLAGLLRVEHDAVGELPEEGVRGVVGYDHLLTHRERLGSGRAQHVRGAGVDEDAVAVQAGVRVVDPSVDLHARQPLGLRLNLVLLGPGAVGVQLGQVVTRVEPHTVPQLTVALGPQRLAQEVGALAEAHLRGVRHGGAHREELGAHAVHVAH